MFSLKGRQRRLFLKGNFMKNRKTVKNIVFSAMCLAIAFVLPFLTGQIPQIGSMLSPMHIPVLLCGFLCGWPWALVVGAAAPLLRSLVLHMPPMYPTAFSMAFEMAVYGVIAALMYKALPKKKWAIYVSLITAMVAGRIVWGTVRFFCAGLNPDKFGLSAFWTGAVANAIPGIILHIVLIPLIVMALEKAKLTNKD